MQPPRAVCLQSTPLLPFHRPGCAKLSRWARHPWLFFGRGTGTRTHVGAEVSWAPQALGRVAFWEGGGAGSPCEPWHGSEGTLKDAFRAPSPSLALPGPEDGPPRHRYRNDRRQARRDSVGAATCGQGRAPLQSPPAHKIQLAALAPLLTLNNRGRARGSRHNELPRPSPPRTSCSCLPCAPSHHAPPANLLLGRN